MIRNRSARTAPGVNPPDAIESEETSRPTGAEDGLRLRAASATDGDARFVGIWDTEEIPSPQDGQNRAEAGTSAEHFGQNAKVERL